jgi:hypothetical protein
LSVAQHLEDLEGDPIIIAIAALHHSREIAVDATLDRTPLGADPDLLGHLEAGIRIDVQGAGKLEDPLVSESRWGSQRKPGQKDKENKRWAVSVRHFETSWRYGCGLGKVSARS